MLTAIVLMLLIKAFVVQVYRIPSASMEDTLRTANCKRDSSSSGR